MPGAGRRRAGLVAASPPSQVAVFVVCGLWLGLSGRQVGAGLAAGALVALGLGVAVGLGTGVARWFVEVPGWLVALCTVAIVSVLVSMLGFRGVELPRGLSVAAGMFVLGLDWWYVPRLRAAVVLSGVFVLPLASGHQPWTLAVTLAWFAGALVAFWLLARDARAAVAQPVAPAGSASRPDRPRTADLVPLLVPALVVGTAAALLLGQPSCSAPSLGSSHGPLTVPAGGRSGAAGGSSSGAAGQGGSGQGGSGAGSSGGAGSAVAGGAGSSSGARGSASAAPGASPASHRGVDWTLVGLVAALAVAVAAVIGLLGWWLTRSDRGGEVPWAEALARRLEGEGRRRGRPRRRDETILAYSAALGSTGGVLGDDRLAPVGEVLSAALFGPAEPPPPTRAWAQQAVDEVIAAHPTARRGRRRARAHDA